MDLTWWDYIFHYAYDLNVGYIYKLTEKDVQINIEETYNNLNKAHMWSSTV